VWLLWRLSGDATKVWNGGNGRDADLVKIWPIAAVGNICSLAPVRDVPGQGCDFEDHH
jgi:hypothetical protein